MHTPEAIRLLREALELLDGTSRVVLDAARIPMARNRVRDALVLLEPPPAARPVDYTPGPAELQDLGD